MLVLFSNEAELPANQALSLGLHEVLSEPASAKPTTYTEYLDLIRFPGDERQARLAAFIKAKYAGIRFDVAITAGPQALDFLSKYRDAIIPGVPIVFAALGEDELRKRVLPAATTGITSRWDIAKTLELALDLQPGARHVTVVTGASGFDKAWEAEAREKFRPYENRLSFTYLAGLPVADVIDRVSHLPQDTIVIVPMFFEDGNGVRYIPRDVLEQLAGIANAPIYTVYDTTIGAGAAGGYMDTFDEVGREAGRLALRIVNGEKAEAIAPYQAQSHRYIVDWRQLKRWGLVESALPPGTEIRYKELTAWEQYTVEIVLILAALILQSILILRLYAEARRRRAAERQARASKERMDLAISAVKLGVWDWDLKTDKIWATKSCREMFGFDDTAELSRRSFADSVIEEDRGRVGSEIDKAIANGQPFETEFRLSQPGGKPQWIATKGSPRGDVGGEANRMVGVVLDVTARKQGELEAEQQRQELAHLSRVSVLGALSGALAHELNQPLTAILSNAQAASRIIARKPVDIEEISQILQDIMQDDKRAGDVIKHLRALLKKEESQMQPVALNGLVDEVLALAHSDLILKDIAVSKQLSEPLPDIHGDPIQLQQVLLNLIVNACEAMSGTPSRDRLLMIATAANGEGQARISVSDSGEGFPAEPDKLFEPFYTTKPLGLGLGLPICRNIVTAHGGRLWAETGHRGGATFHVELPGEIGGHA